MKNKISNGFQIVQDLIKLRWIPEIIKSLEAGNHRYSEIQRSIHHISHTELNRKLSILIERGVILKEDNTDNTKYILLDFGEDLVHIFNHLEALQEKYFEVS
ncbi:MAG: helix-turn-helix transcriptional regulator [Tissierellia bacterium]|nr:helix-turn-helix transcriptional regulator [Tissierellia bacterium]